MTCTSAPPARTSPTRPTPARCSGTRSPATPRPGSRSPPASAATRAPTGCPARPRPETASVPSSPACRAAQNNGVLVGTPAEDVGSARDAGSVTFLRATPAGAAAPSQGWTQETAGIAGPPGTGDRFGASLSYRAPWAAVGTPGDDVGRRRRRGVGPDPPVGRSGQGQEGPGARREADPPSVHRGGRRRRARYAPRRGTSSVQPSRSGSGCSARSPSTLPSAPRARTRVPSRTPGRSRSSSSRAPPRVRPLTLRQGVNAPRYRSGGRSTRLDA